MLDLGTGKKTVHLVPEGKTWDHIEAMLEIIFFLGNVERKKRSK